MAKKATIPSYEGRSAKSWLNDLKLDVDEVRATAAERAFAVMGASVVPFLIEEFARDKLSDAKGAALARAFHVLGSSASSAVPELLRLVEKQPDFITYALSGVGQEGCLALVELVRHSTGLVRVRACEQLADAAKFGRMDPGDIVGLVPELVTLLEDELHLMRWRAASLLGAIHTAPELCVPALMRCLDDSSDGVQGEAALALASYGDAAAVALPRLLELERTAYSPLRDVVIKSLGYFSDARILPVLLNALHGGPSVSTCAIYSLGRQKWPAEVLVPALCDCIEQDVLVWQCAEILGRYGEEARPAVPALRAAMKNATPALRELIVGALEQIEKR